jgi:hypothetical protein
MMSTEQQVSQKKGEINQLNQQITQIKTANLQKLQQCQQQVIALK